MTDIGRKESEEEEALVQGLLRGDAAAYEHLLTRLSDHYVVIIERRYGNRQDAEDIVNEAAYKIISKIDTYDSGKSRSFWNWVYQIIQNQAIDYYRHQENKPQYRATNLETVSNLDKLLVENAPVLSDQQTIDASQKPISQKTVALHRGLSKLSERDRVIIEGHYFTMLTDDEVAETLNVGIANVRKYRSRAIQRLRKLLCDEPEFTDILDSSERTTS